VCIARVWKRVWLEGSPEHEECVQGGESAQPCPRAMTRIESPSMTARSREKAIIETTRPSMMDVHLWGDRIGELRGHPRFAYVFDPYKNRGNPFARLSTARV
jgi:hypothetical protein